ncbi:MAG: hypothetical protein K6U89_17645 [Chloroflexi bacterium]|jgi:hypothetical protein|nr:hypothetical protein [Chloroflexota bacterium]GIW10886.1 MAG: hypothetical protein KatS3mg061_1943 [Dehalococcoidia bacterium]
MLVVPPSLPTALIFFHGGQIGPDEIASYAVGTVAALGLAYLLSKLLDYLSGRRSSKP